MSDKDVETIEALTESILEAMGPEKGIAVLSSVICQLYVKTDQSNAMVLTQPSNGVIVVTSTLDAAEQIAGIVEKTLEQIPEIMKEIIAEDVKPDGDIRVYDGDERASKENVPPKDKLH